MLHARTIEKLCRVVAQAFDRFCARLCLNVALKKSSFTPTICTCDKNCVFAVAPRASLQKNNKTYRFCQRYAPPDTFGFVARRRLLQTVVLQKERRYCFSSCSDGWSKRRCSPDWSIFSSSIKGCSNIFAFAFLLSNTKGKNAAAKIAALQTTCVT